MSSMEFSVGEQADSSEKRFVLIVGSAPTAPDADQFITDDLTVVVVNNAWRAVRRFDYLVYPPDFPRARRPQPDVLRDRAISKKLYIDSCLNHGGPVYCGATMAFAAGYWALARFPGAQVTIFSSDMNYSYGDQPTHFYGTGIADPLRRNISLQNLEATSCRMFYFSISSGTLLLNGSLEEVTRLTLPRIPIGEATTVQITEQAIALYRDRFAATMEAIAAEAVELERASPFDYLLPNYIGHQKKKSNWDYVNKVNASWQRLQPAIESFAEELRHLVRAGVAG